MFTGIVQALGTVIRPGPGRLVLRGALGGDPLALGESIAVSGVCLTVVVVEGDQFGFDVHPETVARTSLGRLVPGDRVNLERALTLATRLGGHLVSGHVDTTVTLLERAPEGEGERHTYAMPADVARYVAYKGSVTLDGTSLTVASREPDRFTVALVPHTLTVTTLGDRSPGDPLNLEVDLVARYLETLLAPRLS